MNCLTYSFENFRMFLVIKENVINCFQLAHSSHLVIQLIEITLPSIGLFFDNKTSIKASCSCHLWEIKKYQILNKFRSNLCVCLFMYFVLLPNIPYAPYFNTNYHCEQITHDTNKFCKILRNKLHWVLLATNKKMQKKLLVVGGCSLHPNF